MKLICEIEDVFDMADRGCVVVPGISCDVEFLVPVGSSLLIVTPKGEQISTSVKGVELINSRVKPVKVNPILLPRDIAKEQLVIGSKVYLVNEAG